MCSAQRKEAGNNPLDYSFLKTSLIFSPIPFYTLYREYRERTYKNINSLLPKIFTHTHTHTDSDIMGSGRTE